jgi:hypothetical protein
MKTLAIVSLKRGVLLYWSLWFSVVLFANVMDRLRTAGYVSPEWKVGFGDFSLISPSASLYGAPAELSGVLIVGVIVWEALAVGFFWRAFAKFHGVHQAEQLSLRAAFILALALFAVFMLADESFLKRGREATHIHVFAALLVSLLVTYVLPEA